MVMYPCPKCNMIFNRKSNYDTHLNKKFDCSLKSTKSVYLENAEKNNLQPFQNFPKFSKIFQNAEKIIFNDNFNLDLGLDLEFDLKSYVESGFNLDYELNIKKKTNKKNKTDNNNRDKTYNDNENDNNNNNNNNKTDNNNSNNNKTDNKINYQLDSIDCDYFQCAFCSKTYSSNGNLTKHLKTNCKVKIEKDNEKENIFRLLLEKDKQKESEINELKEQNKLLLKKIDSLISLSKKSKYHKITTNINSNNTINTTNTSNTSNIVLFNFGKEDLNIIDKQIYFDRVVKKAISGVKIPEEILKIIHFNHQYPQLSNIYISDINRDKCMIFEDGNWKLSSVDKIPQVLEKVVNYSNGVENELRLQYTNNKKVNDRLDIVNKYIKMNDIEYIDELKEEPEDNKDLIKRCENFQKLTYDTIRTTLYNEGKNLKKIIK